MWKFRSAVWLRKTGICAAVAVLLCGCGGQEEQDEIVAIESEEGDETAYEFAEAQIGDVEEVLKITCKYRQVQEQEVTFPMEGRIVDKVYVEEGDRVKKGQLLAELSSRDLERKIEDLEYRIKRNELLSGYLDTNEEIGLSGLWVNSMFNLYGAPVSAPSEESMEDLKQGYRYQREDIEDALEIDREELERVQQLFQSSRIYAAMDGIIYDIKDDLMGSTSHLDEVVMTVMDTSVSLFETQEPEAASYCREGEAVSMTVSYGSGAGEYLLMPWKMDEWGETQLFEVYQESGDAVLEVGTSGTITIITDRREGVLTIPKAAVKDAGDRKYVYVLNEDDMREVKWVETGLYGDSRVEIKSGLSEGERVILR